ncbi:MAG: dTMP kinase [Candidatus Niyogibacteria bacterium]|nr:MAG: dTMP kinase [Candidatus Niyogibacteria bacterium]
MRGIFIVFEGGDFCGKTTQSKRFYEDLKARGLDVIWTKEPGGTPEGVEIRQKLLHGNITPEEEIDLFCEDRRIHYEKVIRPALERGAIVICDRNEYSTIAYQGAGRGYDITEIKRKSGEARGGIEPDLVILADCDPEILQDRAKKRGEMLTRFEKLGMDFHHRVRISFLEQAEEKPEKWRVLDASRSIDEIYEDVKRHTGPLLSKTK